MSGFASCIIYFFIRNIDAIIPLSRGMGVRILSEKDRAKERNHNPYLRSNEMDKKPVKSGKPQPKASARASKKPELKAKGGKK